MLFVSIDSHVHKGAEIIPFSGSTLFDYSFAIRVVYYIVFGNII